MNHRLLLTFAVLSSCGTLVPAQSRASRALTNIGGANERIDGVSIGIDNGGLATILNMDSVESASVQTNVDIPGDFVPITTAGFLVAGGENSGGGILEYWAQDNAGAYVLVSAVTVPGKDFVGVTYDATADKVFVLDAVAKEILRAPWDGVAGLPPASSWIVYATQTDVPDLANAADRYLRCLVGDDGEGVLFLGVWPESTFTPGYEITGVPGNLSVKELNWHESFWRFPFLTYAPPPELDIIADETTASEGANTLDVVALEGTIVEVLHAGTQQVLGTGVVPPGQNRTTVTLSTALQIGHHYIARKFGDVAPTGYNFECLRRYGFPETYADGTQLRRLYAPRDVHVGNQSLMILMGCTKPTPPTSPQVLTGMMSIASRNGGVDPVVPFGNNILLLPASMVPASGVIEQAGHGWIHGVMAVPNDPALAGAVILFQFLMMDGQSIRLSEVIGAELRPES